MITEEGASAQQRATHDDAVAVPDAGACDIGSNVGVAGALRCCPARACRPGRQQATEPPPGVSAAAAQYAHTVGPCSVLDTKGEGFGERTTHPWGSHRKRMLCS